MKKKNLDFILKANGFEDMGSIGEIRLPILQYLPKELLRDREFLLKLKKKEIQNQRRMSANENIKKPIKKPLCSPVPIIKIIPTARDRPDKFQVFYTGRNPIFEEDTKKYTQKILANPFAKIIRFDDFKLQNIYKENGAAVDKGPHPERIGYDKSMLREKRVRFEEIKKQKIIPRAYFFNEHEENDMLV